MAIDEPTEAACEDRHICGNEVQHSSLWNECHRCCHHLHRHRLEPQSDMHVVWSHRDFGCESIGLLGVRVLMRGAEGVAEEICGGVRSFLCLSLNKITTTLATEFCSLTFQGRKKQHKHKLFGPDFPWTFLTLTPGCPGVKKFLPATGAAGKRTFWYGRPRFSAWTSMTRRVVQKLCTKKVCVDSLALTLCVSALISPKLTLTLFSCEQMISSLVQVLIQHIEDHPHPQ